MIPKKINRNHLVEAARIVDREGTPKIRESTKYDVIVGEQRYPPKYLIAVASKLATGKMIPAISYNGGQESNSFLRSRGFTITDKNGNVVDYP